MYVYKGVETVDGYSQFESEFLSEITIPYSLCVVRLEKNEKMTNKIALYSIFALVILATILHGDVEARYLPARGSPERLEKLRELLKELLENEIEKEDFGVAEQGPRWHPESKLFYKREVPLAN